LSRVFVDLKGEEMAKDRKIGRRELITRSLSGGLAAGTFALAEKTALRAADQKKEILIEDISTLGELPKQRSCAPYNTERFKCGRYETFLNPPKPCRTRYSARCLEVWAGPG
jgi:hypothetical protein